MSQNAETAPLGLLRLRAEARLGELVEVSGESAEDLWELAASAQEMPRFLETFGEDGEAFWQAFQNLRRSETEELARQLQPAS